MPVGRGAKQRLATETNHMVWDYLFLTSSYPLVFTSHSLVISMQFDHYLHTPYRKLQHRFIDLRSIHTSILSAGNARFPYNKRRLTNISWSCFSQASNWWRHGHPKSPSRVDLKKSLALYSKGVSNERKEIEWVAPLPIVTCRCQHPIIPHQIWNSHPRMSFG